ncbi:MULTISPECIES: hypothetical protein [Acetobacteraceae]|uniref:Uncharacterized protein n=1 Tax=Endobacter medicaginis TaxID=1181271 RepID=A0A839UTX9_9PROT|nr:hypothetical protein [Endobacter medicaginis]TCS29549.1 hypothetical protein EDC31_106120 [Acidomonas methanolica]
MKKHDTTPLPGLDEQDARCFQRAADLVDRALMDTKATLGFKALERGQCYEGFFSEPFLCPVQECPCRPYLSASDHP